MPFCIPPPRWRWHAYASDALLWGSLFFGACFLFGWSDASFRTGLATLLRGGDLQVILNAYDAQSLTAGAPVRFAGLTVGEVKFVEPLLQERKVRIAYVLKTALLPNLPTGAVASIASSGLGGAKSLQFDLPSTGKLVDQAVGGGQETAMVSSVRQRVLQQEQITMLHAFKMGSDALNAQFEAHPIEQLQAQVVSLRKQSQQNRQQLQAWTQHLAALQTRQHQRSQAAQRMLMEANQGIAASESLLPPVASLKRKSPESSLTPLLQTFTEEVQQTQQQIPLLRQQLQRLNEQIPSLAAPQEAIPLGEKGEE